MIPKFKVNMLNLIDHPKAGRYGHPFPGMNATVDVDDGLPGFFKLLLVMLLSAGIVMVMMFAVVMNVFTRDGHQQNVPVLVSLAQRFHLDQRTRFCHFVQPFVDL